MNTIHRLSRTALAVVAMLAWTPGHAAESPYDDAVRAAYLEEIRWDNIDGPPFLLEGGRHALRREDGLVWVTLASGARMTLHLDAGEALGIQPRPGASLEALDVYSSNGSGLLRPIRLEEGAKPELHVARASISEPSLIHLHAGRESLELALFRERVVRLEPPQRLRTAVGDNNLPDVRLSTSSLRAGEPFERILPGAPGHFDVTGPALVEVMVRVAFTHHPFTSTELRLTSRLDGEFVRDDAIVAHQDTRRVFRIDGEPALVSRGKPVYLAVPEGEHDLELATSREALVRVRATPPRPYRFPRANESAAERAAAARIDALVTQDTALELDRLAGDNLALAAPLQAAALAATRAPALVPQLMLRHTKLADLVPASRNEPFTGRYAYYTAPALRSPLAPATPFVVGDRQVESAHERLPGAWFVELAGAQPVTYALPPLPYASTARVIVDRRSLGAQAPIVVARGGERESLLVAPSHTGLLEFDVTRLRAADAPEHLVSDAVAVAEFEIPAGTSTLTLTPGAAVSVALQLRLPQAQQAEEADWIRYRDGFGATLLDLWRTAAEAGLDRATLRWDASRALAAADGERARLFNHWIPLFHYLSGQAAQFRGEPALEIAGLDCEERALPPSDDALAARSLEQRGQWLAASTAWHRALQRGTGCLEAHLGLVDDLVRLGEHTFAEDYLRTLVLHARDGALARRSAEQLAEYYRAQRLDYASVRLAAHVALLQPNEDTLWELVRALMEGGQKRFAIDVALALPTPGRSPAVQVALRQLGWTELADRIGAAAEATASDIRIDTDRLRPARTDAVEFPAGAVVHDLLLDHVEGQLVATAGAGPIRTTLTGPARVRLSLRPLISTSDDPSATGWATVIVDDRRFAIPLRPTISQSRFELLGDPRRLGTAVERELVLGAGTHTVQIVAETWDVAVEMLLREPWSAARPPSGEAPAARGQPVRLFAQAPDRAADIDVRRLEPPLALQPQEGLPTVERDWSYLLSADDPGSAAAAQRLASLAYLLERTLGTDDPRRDGAIAASEALGHAHAGDREVASLLDRIRRLTTWESLETVAASAGTRVVTHDHYVPESPSSVARNLFLPEWQPGETVLAPGERFELGLRTRAARAIRVEITRLATRRQGGDDAVLALSIDARTTRSIRLAEGATGSADIEIPAGEHLIAFDAPALPRGQTFKVRVLEKSRTRARDQWRPVVEPLGRRYAVATREQPVVFDVLGPAWLRADTRDGTHVSQQYRYIGAGWQRVAFAAEGAATDHRVFVRRPAREATSGAFDVRVQTPPTAPWPGRRVQTVVASRATSPQPAVRLPLAGQSRGTTSISSRYVNTNALEEDSALPGDRYVEGGASYRRFDELRDAYVRADAIGRARSSDGATFGARGAYLDRLGDGPLSAVFDARAYAQDRDLGGLATSATLAGGVRHVQPFGPLWLSTLDVSAFARWLSEDDGRGVSDRDVFTPYKHDHRNGLRLREQLSWRPSLDTEIFGAFALATNEIESPGIDYVLGSTGLRLNAGPLQVELGYDRQRYFDDDDRGGSLTLDRLGVETRYNRWLERDRRVEVTGALVRDMDRGEYSGEIGVTWHLGNGRGLRDFHSSETWFDDLLERDSHQPVSPP